LAVFDESFSSEGWDHGGETYESGLERAADVIGRLRARYMENDRVAIAVHGAFANFLLRSVLHMPPSRSLWFSTNNCSLTIVRFHAAVQNEEDWMFSVEVEVLCVNDVSHLSEIS
jgi:broad specificity phosphatase PhoE